jgi:diguanylate cyclase (GGDEF)-like protein
MQDEPWNMAVRREKSRVATRSPFTDRLHVIIERWAAQLPPELQQAFRDEVGPLADEYDRSLETIEIIWRRREQEYALDQSTGLALRRHFLQHLVTLLGTPATPACGAIGVVFIDLDNLKAINDTCGHPAGDRAIAAVAGIIRHTVRISRHVDLIDRPRESDGEYAVSRHGGDEFLVVLELRDPSEIDLVAPRLKRHIDDVDKQRAHGYDSPARLAASVGGVAYELREKAAAISRHEIAKALVNAADELMYESKRDGLVHLAVARYTDRFSIDHRHVRDPSSVH